MYIDTIHNIHIIQVYYIYKNLHIILIYVHIYTYTEACSYTYL